MSPKPSRHRVTKTKLLAVRVPESLLHALDEHARVFRGGAPGIAMSRSDMVRWLLTRALDRESDSLAKNARKLRPGSSP